MPFPFSLPTTSSLSYPSFACSNTHPSLPLAATTHRSVLRNILKQHKRIPPPSRSANLSTVLRAVGDYLPYLSALSSGLNGRTVNDEEIDVALRTEITVEWRTTLTSSPVPGREPPRIKGKGIDYELAFVYTTLAFIYTILARSQLHMLYASVTPTAEQRTSIITTATKYLLEANSIHSYLASHAIETDGATAVVETLSQTQSGLAALSMAEATLLAVLKDDPYPAVVAQDRNKNDKEWMISAPDIPKVRAHLYARLCLAATEHAARAEAMLSASGKLEESLMRYVKDLKRTCKAKACRFFGIDAELGGETGKGLAWLLGAKRELGYAIKEEEGGKIKGLAKLKKDWTERREDKKVENGGEWGADAGRLEELRVVEMLEKKWKKINDTINTQLVPPSDPLVASMPSGRDMYTTKVFVPPVLDEETLVRIRAPPEKEAGIGVAEEDNDSSDDDGEGKASAPPGAFPGASGNPLNDSPYY